MKLLWEDQLRAMEKSSAIPLQNFIKISGILDNASDYDQTNGKTSPQYKVNYLKRNNMAPRECYSPPSKVIKILPEQLSIGHTNSHSRSDEYYNSPDIIAVSSPENNTISSTQYHSAAGSMCKSPQPRMNKPDCNKCQPHIVLQRFMDKVKCSKGQNTNWIERELSVKELRQIIPLLMLKAFESKCVPALRKVKGIWEKPPEGWPEELPYCDPNNGNKAFGKPRKDILVKILVFLLKRCKESEEREQGVDYVGEVSSSSENSYRSKSPQMTQLHSDSKNYSEQFYQSTPTKTMPSLIPISALSPISDDQECPCSIIEPNNYDYHLSSDSPHCYINQRSTSVSSVSSVNSKEDSMHASSSYRSYSHSRSYSYTESPVYSSTVLPSQLNGTRSPHQAQNVENGWLSDSDKSKFSNTTVVERYITKNIINDSRNLNNGSDNKSRDDRPVSCDQSYSVCLDDVQGTSSQAKEMNYIHDYKKGEPIGIKESHTSINNRNPSPKSPSSDYEATSKESKLLKALMGETKKTSNNSSFSVTHPDSRNNSDTPPDEINPLTTIYDRIEEKVHFIHWKGWIQNKQLTLLYLTLGDFGKMKKHVKMLNQEVFLENIHSFESTLDLILMQKKMLDTHEKKWQNFLTYENSK